MSGFHIYMNIFFFYICKVITYSKEVAISDAAVIILHSTFFQ